LVVLLLRENEKGRESAMKGKREISKVRVLSCKPYNYLVKWIFLVSVPRGVGWMNLVKFDCLLLICFLYFVFSV